MDFWNKNIEDMRAVPLKYTKERADEYCTDKIDCYLIKLTLNKQKQAIYAYLFYPKTPQRAAVRWCCALREQA